MFTGATNNPCQSLSDPFDYRQDALVIPVGYELRRLKTIIEQQGNNFEEFLDDLVTTLRSKVSSAQEYFLFKMEVVCGSYLRIPANEVIALQLGQLLDVLYAQLKQVIVHEHLYVGNRFDYNVQNHSNHVLLFTKTM